MGDFGEFEGGGRDRPDAAADPREADAVAEDGLIGFGGAFGSLRGEDATGVEGREMMSALVGVSFCFLGGMGWRKVKRGRA